MPLSDVDRSCTTDAARDRRRSRARRHCAVTAAGLGHLAPGVAGRRVGRAPTAVQPPGNLKFPGAIPALASCAGVMVVPPSSALGRWRPTPPPPPPASPLGDAGAVGPGAHHLDAQRPAVGGSQHPGRGQSSVSLLRLSYPPAGEPRV